MRRTKIVCTLGPATHSRERIQDLIRAGMDVARLNFSHGTREQHAQAAQWVREASQAAGRPVAILQDLCGPKIRTGRLRGGRPLVLRKGQRLRLTSRDVEGTARRISVSYPGLARDLRKGDRLLLNDGLIELRVMGVEGVEGVAETAGVDGTAVETVVLSGGELGERKGVNLPGVKLRVATLTPKDEADLRFGVELGVDYVALSFVRRASDVRRVKTLLAKLKAAIPVLAKLEKPEAVKNLDAILAASDGVMVARGDLGVEMPPERVPMIQKRIIHKAATARIPVITATQMLESMTVNPRPTRAEASDVANAIFDGTDALMLSGETAAGRYPVEAVEMMARIAQEAEAARDPVLFRREKRSRHSVAEAISESVVHVTHMLDVKAVVVFTRSGSTARLISKRRPPRPVYAFCHDESIARRAALYWGVTPIAMPLNQDADSTLARAEAALLRRKLVAPDDLLAVAAGKPGNTNLMKLLHAGTG